ncbi:hypothetical protein [Anabaena sp. UHCC 0451]|uniref:hypothetical protein n=1 Tax=Anabaena sp. UHCC 0451 TaxID=2055235 RepID=UPI002B20B3B7|nr:hypothetical protein [Anabaena sp. UHCC 0451]MEA5578836.1 hypothetical protein [Anabaena sp. UHCC 0451]
MSSGSSSRYQSKLFNFINQHSQRLTQQWENTFRNFQVATKWSVEALLYPLYQIFQPDEFAGKRLEAKPPKPQTQLQPEPLPSTDAPIQQVLELVKNLPSAAASEIQTLQNFNPLAFLGNSLREAANRLGWSKSHSYQNIQPENTLQHHIPNVQGIAVTLENRHLVLVSENNRILDVLTIQQQAKLNNRINSEVAEYWHSLKSAQVNNQQNILPEIDRILTKLTDSNHHSITELPESNFESNFKFNIQSYYPGRFLEFIDIALAKLETQGIVPVKQHSQGIIQVVQTQLEIFIYGREQVETRREMTINADGLENQTLDIPALIESAINYFFGGRKIPKFEKTEIPPKLPSQPVNKVIQNSHVQSPDIITDSWLSWGELFGDLEEINANEANLGLTASGVHLFKHQESTKKTSSHRAENETRQEQHPHQLKPDWIETTATFLGYEKHPLEQILAWLDHLMLWMEMIFMNMIYFFKGLLQV